MQAKSTQEKMILTAYLVREEAIFFIRHLVYKSAFHSLDFSFSSSVLSRLEALDELSADKELQAERLVREGRSRQEGLKLLSAGKRISKFYLKRFQYFFPKFYQEVGLDCHQQLAHLRLASLNAALDDFPKLLRFLARFGRQKYLDQLRKATQASFHYSFLFNLRQKHIFLQRNNRNQKLLLEGWDEWLFDTVFRALLNLFSKLRYKSTFVSEESLQQGSLRKQCFLELAVKAKKNYLEALSKAGSKHIELSFGRIESMEESRESSKRKSFLRTPKIRLKSLVQKNQFKLHPFNSPKAQSKKTTPPQAQYTLLKSTLLQPLFQFTSLINLKAKLSLALIKSQPDFSNY